jgi:hypothetical protein
VTVLLCIYVLGLLGFGGVLLGIGRFDYPWPVLVMAALGWPALLVGLFLIAIVLRLLGAPWES